MKGATRWIVGVSTLVALGGSWPGLAAERPYALHGIVSISPTRAADFTLTAHTGKRVHLSDFRGKVVLIYFGYTFCPGICPTTLAEINQALNTLGPKKAEKVSMIMISVDPERDTPDRMAAYVSHFNPSFIGATGTPDETKAVASRYGIYYKKQEDTAANGYLVDHTSAVIVVDQKGYVRVLFPFNTAVKDMADDLAYLLR